MQSVAILAGYVILGGTSGTREDSPKPSLPEIELDRGFRKAHAGGA
jgi:hypothetical protein